MQNAKDRNVAPTVKTTATNYGVVVIDGEEKRIRIFTPKECFRLQGVKDEDYYKVKQNQSETGLYHLSGDSICSVCLVAIFGQLLGVDWKKTIVEIQNGVMKKIGD